MNHTQASLSIRLRNANHFAKFLIFFEKIKGFGLELMHVALPVFAFKPSLHRCLENKKQNEIFMKKSVFLPS